MSIAQDETVIARKGANAFFKEVEAGVSNASDIGRQLNLAAVVAKGIMGGLWVGGYVTLTKTDIVFAPNAINRNFHEGDIDWRLPLSDIDDVQVKFGFVTLIIELTFGNVLARFRCWKAKDFAQQIRHQIDQDKKRS